MFLSGKILYFFIAVDGAGAANIGDKGLPILGGLRNTKNFYERSILLHLGLWTALWLLLGRVRHGSKDSLTHSLADPIYSSVRKEMTHTEKKVASHT